MDDVGSWRGAWLLAAVAAMGCAEGMGTSMEAVASSECVQGEPDCPSQDTPAETEPGAQGGAGGAAGGSSEQGAKQGSAGADGGAASGATEPLPCGGLDTDGDGTFDCDDACPHNANLVEACVAGRMAIAIDGSQVPSALAGFPLLVRLVESAELAMHADLDGQDIHFEDTEGKALAADIESYDGGTLVAWVRLDLTGEDQQLVMRYGGGDRRTAQDGSGVWDQEFEGVYHLDGIDDASANGRHGTDVGSTAHEAGQLGAARDFDGNSEILIGTGLLPSEDDYTISFWGRVDYDSGDDPKWAVSSAANAAPYEGFAVGVDKPTGHPLTWNSGWESFDTLTVPDLGWVFVVARIHAASAGGYVEYSLDGGAFERLSFGDTEQQRTAASSVLVIGGEGAKTHENWLGQLDEVRISSTLRSDAWLQLAHDSQRQGATLVTVGDHEDD